MFIIDFIKNNLFLFIIIVICVLIIAISAIFLGLAIRAKKLEKKYNSLKNAYKALEIIPVSEKLDKVKEIGKHNIAYLEVANNYEQNYNQFMKNAKLENNEMCILLGQYVADRKFKKFAECYEEAHQKLIKQQERLNDIVKALDDILKQEDDLKEAEQNLRFMYASILDSFQASYEHLKPLENEFKALFAKIEEAFNVYNDYLLKGLYSEANEILTTTKDNLDYLKQIVSKTPMLARSLMNELPASLNEVIDLYNDMQKQGYPLYHLVMNSKIVAIKEDLLKAIKDLKTFKVDALGSATLELSAKVKALKEALVKEADCKQQYEAKNDAIYNRSEEIERGFIKFIKESEEMSKIYSFGEENKELDETIKKEITNLSITRRALETLIYGNQPYSFRYEKLIELENQIQKVESYMKTSNTTISSMKGDSEEAYNLVDEAIYKLKILELEIRNSQYENISLFYKDQIADTYALIERLNTNVNRTPIDTIKVKQLSNELASTLKELETSARKMIADANESEQLLVFANAYRSSDSNIARDLSKAELFFYDGRYAETCEILKQLLNQFDIKRL